MELIPGEHRIRWVLEKAAALTEGGASPVSGQVLPTGRFFPDRFDKTDPHGSIERIVARVVKLAGMTEFDIDAGLNAGGSEVGGGCSSGACSPSSAAADPRRVVPRLNGGYRLQVSPAEVGQPVGLLTGIVRGVSHVFLKESHLDECFEGPEYEWGIDLTGALLGFGSLLGNGAYQYRKG
ncbi:MAG: hypothetical protein AAGA56_08965 [Myxococcota bacterium]